MRKLLMLLAVATAVLMAMPSALCQLQPDEYARAVKTRSDNRLLYGGSTQVTWVSGTSQYWFLKRTKAASRYMAGDASQNSLKEAFDHQLLARQLSEKSGETVYPDSLRLERATFVKEMQAFQFGFKNSNWEFDIATGVLTQTEGTSSPAPQRGQQSQRYWGARDNSDAAVRTSPSPDNKIEAFIRDYNLFIREISSGKVTQLSFDGASEFPYTSQIRWSPDGKKLTCMKVRQAQDHIITFIESSPANQIQPRIQTRPYYKPGDVIPVSLPALFNVETGKQIFIDTKELEYQYDLQRLEWEPESRSFTFEWNQRGHQVYRLYRVDAETGAKQIVAEERSNTFVNYPRIWRYKLRESGELLWASERDGWYHLYLLDAATGKVKNQITKGEWAVRDVVRVDAEKREILFTANGKNPGEDPYNIHYYRIGFDGTNLIDLTPENGNHTVQFSPDNRYYTDYCSRPDLPGTTVLRSWPDTKVLQTLQSTDVSELEKAGWKMPVVFSAKGRDGVTDIWGTIIFPRNFNPKKRYPVIEYIYAGPHGQHVPKSFSVSDYSISPLTDLGFVVVRIDGMGTAFRSKAFHDVAWQNLKDAGFPDRILWMKAAAQKYKWMDISRVGIFGSSAGGQNAMGAVLFHNDFYKSAYASCGCHDNRMDKIWWNELWMGYPVGAHYSASSNVDNAHLLKANLMLAYGEVDDNVDPATTLQVANALIKANKEFELVVLPGVNHTMGGEYGMRKMYDFFIRTLRDQVTPNWNK